MQDDRNGYLVDKDIQISQKLFELLGNKKKLNDLSKQSFFISQNYTAESHVLKVENFYKKVLELYPDKLSLLQEQTNFNY